MSHSSTRGDDLFASARVVHRSSTAEETANGIRDLILRGELRPGTPLTEVRLASAYGVSCNTVREALLLLAWEGIVTQNRHRGSVVTTLTENDIRDLCSARRLLETAAVDASPLTADDNTLDAIGRALDALVSAVELDDWHAIPLADVGFHRALVGLLGSPRLEGFYQQLESEIRLAALIVTRRDVADGQSIIEEHREAYELLRAGRHRECGELLARMINESEEYLLASYLAAR